jgi:cell division GTPase FtsZ
VEIIPGVAEDLNLKDGLRVTIIATGFDAVKTEEDSISTVLDFENFVNQKYKTDKASSSEPVAEGESDLLSKLSEGQYEIPAFMRRRMATKNSHN